MSDAENFSVDKPINPYYHSSAVNNSIAINEHNHINEMLLSAGIEVINVQSPVGCQDGVYTANWALVRGEKAVLASLPNARKDEEDYAENILRNLGKKVIRIPAGLRFSGQGDALACGNLLFCGSGYRSDEEAQKFAAETLGYDRIQLQTVPLGNNEINISSGWPDSFFYDIDLALAIIKAPTDSEKGLIAYCKEAFLPSSQEMLENLQLVDKIIVSLDEAKEAFATNLVSTGETVVMSAKAPELSAKLRDYGLKVLTPEIAELAKGGGYIRCVTLTID